MSTFVKSPLVLLVTAAALLAFGPTPARARDLPATRANSAPAVHDAAAVSVARRTFLRFTAACLAHDRTRIARAVTDDIVLEYDLPDPGLVLTVDGARLDGLCAASSLTAAAGQISNLSIFPMTDPNAVFIQYETSGADAREYMAIVELRGDRIAKIRNFTTPGEIASIATEATHHTIP